MEGRATFDMLYEDIYSLANQLPSVFFTHVKRHQNQVAHSIAKCVLLYSQDFFLLNDVPKAFRLLV